jgi:putative tryptophan/tyrosine transport system permease protein
MDYILGILALALGYFPMSVGLYFSLNVFRLPDITTDGSFTLGGAVSAVMILSGISPLVALIGSVVAGATAGACTGIIHTKIKVQALLAGILVMTGLYSVNLWIMVKSNLPLLDTPSVFNMIGGGSPLPFAMVLTVIIMALVVYLLKTDYGLVMRATGENDTMTAALGVRTDRIKITGLAIANGFVALSGSLMVQLQGFSDINMGMGIVIAGLASVMMGDSLLTQFKSNSIFAALLCLLAGTLIYRYTMAAVLSAGIDPMFIRLITALLVLMFLGIRFKQKENHR